VSDGVTSEEMKEFARQLRADDAIDQPWEAYYAIRSGWDRKEFLRLYKIYIESTQVDLKSAGNNTTESKGNPLEDVARYFLEKGGVARDVKSGGMPGKWTVDGMGETYPDRLNCILGDGTALMCGPKMYMEAKNHNDAMSPEHWAQHCVRMSNHKCRFGVVFSTGGYKVGHGKGYADVIFHDFLRGVLHILLSVADLQAVAMLKEFPWAVVRTAYIRTTDRGYETAEVQKKYTSETCLGLAKSEYARLHAA